MVFRLKEIREKQGISQVKLAQMSGVSRPVIINMEKDGGATVKTDTILDLARALQIDPGDLFYPLCNQ